MVDYERQSPARAWAKDKVEHVNGATDQAPQVLSCSLVRVRGTGERSECGEVARWW